jgi:prevent-host-death family protein
MKTVSISELKARLSAFLDAVRQGDEVLVTDRGRPVARLAPVKAARHQESRRELLLRTGRLRAPTTTRPRDFLSRRLPDDARGRSLSALLQERES